MSDNLDKSWAVIKAGGKQHVAHVGTKIVVNRVEQEEGSSIDSVDELTKDAVSLKVVRHFLGKKVNGLKFKNKVRYLKRYGHRQPLSELELVSIGEKKQQAEKKTEKKEVV